jgi:diamine N-acetyltransferase
MNDMSLFRAPRHDLGQLPGSTEPLYLRNLPPGEAERLGDIFSKIDPWASYPISAAYLSEYLSTIEPGAPRFALMSGADVIGAVGLRLNWLRGPYLQFIGIVPAFQNRGLGSRFLTWMESTARAGYERNLWVCASDFNNGGIKFYERHGFVRVADLDGLLREGRQEVLFRKRL